MSTRVQIRRKSKAHQALNAKACLPPTAKLRASLRSFLQEDMGIAGDVTSVAMIDSHQCARAFVVARTAGVLAGTPVIQLLATFITPAIQVVALLQDGEPFTKGQKLFRISGSLRGMLLIERTMLNILGRMCGVATLTREFVKRVHATNAQIRDTRKTTPGLRAFEKYAVVCGGGVSHRAGLFDAFLAKDNHVAGLNPAHMAAHIQRAVVAARAKHALRFAMVEVDNHKQLQAILQLPVGTIDAILLDNMSTTALRKAVIMRDRLAPQIQLEASGGVTLKSVGAIAKTGIDFVSVGAITHSAPQIDLALDIHSSFVKASRG